MPQKKSAELVAFLSICSKPAGENLEQYLLEQFYPADSFALMDPPLSPDLRDRLAADGQNIDSHELSRLWQEPVRSLAQGDLTTSNQLLIAREYAILVEAGVPTTSATRIICNAYQTHFWFKRKVESCQLAEKAPDALLRKKQHRASRRDVTWALLNRALHGKRTSPALAQAVMTVAAILPKVATETAELTYAQRISLVEKQLAGRLRLQ